MATDTNQTIQDSRRAAMSFLEAAKKKEERRNNRTPGFSGDTNTAVESRPRLEEPDDFTDTAIEESIRKGAKNRRAAKRAVDDFWRAAMRKSANNGISAAAQNGGDTDFDLADRIRRMSDEEFDKAVASGALTPEQIRRAGEYEFDTYMGDVWSEGDHDDEVEPTYEEFVANPQKYGVTYTDEDAANDPDMDMYPVNWGRYNPARLKKQ